MPPYPSIYIGAADVYPIELIAAYSAFATLGTRASPTAILRVDNAKGDVLWEPSPVLAPVMTPDEAWIMVSMMKDVVQRGTAAASVGSQFSYPAGGKTGTTNDGADVWFIGYTSDLVAGVWMGLDKPGKIKGNAQGGILAAPAWTAFMREVYRRKPAPPDWPRPQGVQVRLIDPTTGLLAGAGCAGSITEYFLQGTEPTASCTSITATPGSGVPGGGGIDTSFGFPASTPQNQDSLAAARARTASPGSMVIPGATPMPRASRPARPLGDTTRARRDSVKPPQ